jgi:hypothetical protein
VFLYGSYVYHKMKISEFGFVPLGRPGHSIVEGDERRGDVENLLAKSAPGIEDGVVGGTGKGVLPV